MADALAVLPGRTPLEAFEELGEVARVKGEGGSDIGNGTGRLCQLLPGDLHEALLEVIAGRVARDEPDRITQMRGMDAEQIGDVTDLVHRGRTPGQDIVQMGVYGPIIIGRDFMSSVQNSSRKRCHSERKYKARSDEMVQLASR